MLDEIRYNDEGLSLNLIENNTSQYLAKILKIYENLIYSYVSWLIAAFGNTRKRYANIDMSADERKVATLMT